MRAVDVIAKLAVQGAGAFGAAMSRAAGQVKQVGDAGKKAQSSMSSFGKTAMAMMTGSLGASAIMSLGRGVTGAIGGIAQGITQAGVGAVQTSNQFEEMTAALTALSGSADIANQKMQFIKALAIPSRYTALELAEAGLMVEGLGLNLEKVLPLVTKLTMGTGRTGADYQRMAVGSLFGRLAQGMTPELEAMGAFGISKSALAEFGAVFGRNGELVSSAEEALNAIEGLIESRFGRVLDVVGQTGQAKLSALADQWEQLMASVGDALKRGLMPIIERVSGWLEMLRESGWVDQLVARLGNVFQAGGQTLLGPIDAVMATVLAYAERLPDLMKAAGQWLGTALTNSLGPVADIVDQITTGSLLLRVDRAIQEQMPEWMFGARILGGRNKADVMRDFDLEIGRRENWARIERANAAKKLAEGFSDIPGTAGVPTRIQELLALRAGFIGSSGAVPSSGGVGWGTLGGMPGVVQPLADIAAYTRETADNTRQLAEVRRYVVGGGGAAGVGITPVEIASMRGRAGGMQVRVNAGSRHLSDALSELFATFVVQARRQGLMT